MAGSRVTHNRDSTVSAHPDRAAGVGDPPSPAVTSAARRPGDRCEDDTVTSHSAAAARRPDVGTLTLPYDLAVREHGPTVLRVCRAVLGGDVEAEDAWSETFLAALQAWPELPATTNVQAWLVTVAHRKAVDIIRRRVRHAVPYGDLPEPPLDAGPDHSAALDLRRVVALLPERQRLCVAYHHLGGLPYNDVAALIGGTPAAARRAAADGIAALRRHLAQNDPEDP